MRYKYLCAAFVMFTLFQASQRSIAAEATAPVTGTLQGDAIAKAFDSRYGIWFVGPSLPLWLRLDLPDHATAGEALALLRTALGRNPDAIKEGVAIGAETTQAQQAAETALGYHLEEVTDAQGKIYALRYAVAAAYLSAEVKSPGTLPSTMPAVTTADKNATLMLRYENVPLSMIMTDMARQFGWVFVIPTPATSRVTVQISHPVKADEAIAVLKQALESSGFALLPMKMGERTVFCVMPTTDARRALAAFAYGNDPIRIPQTSGLLTQIVPLKYLQGMEVAPYPMPVGFPDEIPDWLLSARRHNCAIITDISDTVRQRVKAIEMADVPPAERMVIQFVQVIHANAADVATVMNAKYGLPATIPATTAPMSGKPGRMYFDSDARTNTVVINGPAPKVEEAVVAIHQLDADAGK